MDDAFTRDTAVKPLGDGRFGAEVADDWGVLGGVPNGGYLVAIAARAMRHDLAHPDPVSVTAHFLAPPQPGAVEVAVDVLRAGGRHSTVQGRFLQDGRECMRVLGTFADLSQADGHTTMLRQQPALPPLDEAVDVNALAHDSGWTGTPLAPPIMGRFDHRMTRDELGWARGEPTGKGVVSGYTRFAEGTTPDTIGLLLIADAYPPAVFNTGGPSRWVPTIELTVQVRKRPAEGYLACRFATTAVTDGYLEEDGEIWDAEGDLVALSRQLALTPRA